MSKKKLIIIIVVCLVVVALVVANLGITGSNAMAVNADQVIREDIIEVVSASGRIQPRTKVDITSEVNGEIIALPVKEGDRVQAGQLLVVLDTVQLKSNVDQARYAVSEINARLEGAKAQLEQTEEEYERQKRLYESDLTSETTYQNALYAWQNAKASYEAMRAQAKQFQARYEQQLDNLRKAKIVAPMDGIITYLDCEVGEIAAAQSLYSQGRTLMTISDLEVFEVEVEVDETEINKVQTGQHTDIEVDAYPDTTFNGEVVEVGNTAITSAGQDQSTNFRVKVVFQDPDVMLRPGMSATVDITTAKREDVLTVPYSSVVVRSFDFDSLQQAHDGDSAGVSKGMVGSVHAAESDEKEGPVVGEGEEDRVELKGVYVIRDGKARFVEIETGIADSKRIEVLQGLTEEDSVVAGPYRVLRTVSDGDEVESNPKRVRRG
jgi:HlyD family secretion protein